MAFRSSPTASLFSLQPSQRTGLSSFGRYGADLPKIGSMQEFLDPSLDGGEGLSLEGTEEPLDRSTLQQGEGGELISSTTGARVPGESIFGATTGAKTPAQPAQEAPNQTQADPLRAAQLGIQAGTKGLTAFESLRNLFGSTPSGDALQGAPGETKFNVKAPALDWNEPDAVGQWLASNPEAQYSLFGQEVGQSPQEISSWLQKTGDFDLGDTKLDASFLDSFDGGTAPTTGTQTPVGPGAGQLVGAGATAVSAASTIISALQAAGVGNETTQAVARALGGVGTIAGLARATQGGALPDFTKIGQALGLTGAASNAAGVADALLGGTVEGIAAGAEAGVDAVLDAAGPYVAVVKALFDIAMIAAGEGSDEEKAIAAAQTAIKAAAMIAAPATFGASLAVLQIVDFANYMRAGKPLGESLVRANDPSSIFGEEASISRRIFEPSHQWQTFVPELYQNVGQQSQAFGVLGQALPYVQSKEELGNLLNSYRNYLSVTTGITPENYGSVEGAPGSVYSIAKIPGVGPRTHGQATTPVDWAEPTQALMRAVQEIYPRLPGEPITTAYGQPGGGLETPEERLRLWDQFIQGGGTLQPRQLAQEYPGRFENLSDIYSPYYMNFGQTPLISDVTGRAETYVQSLMTAARESEARRRAEEDLAMQMWMQQQASNQPGG